jgi:pyruvate/2-oxoglutarate/acetoin dehydrogenase E1 component
MLYKDAINLAMVNLAKQEKTVFIGYNTRCSKGNGTLKGIDDSQLIETPVAENLMMGIGIGMALKGYKPVVYFERFDFILNALDAIVNHLDKINSLSKNQYDPKVLIRVVVGGSKNPLFTCISHTQDFTKPLSEMVSFPVIKLKNSIEVISEYENASKWKTSMILIEERDLYNCE